MAAGATDHDLPELIFLSELCQPLTGFQFLETLAGLSNNYLDKLRVVMVCSATVRERRAEAFSYRNVIGFYTKPFTDGILLDLMERMSAGQTG